MTETDIAVRRAVPWWHWLICALGLVWSAFGAFDYVMSMTQNADYMAQFSQELLDYWYAMPGWLTAFWALAVWGGLLGWILALIRSRYAVPVFIVSLVSMAINFGYSLIDGGLALQAEQMGAGAAYGFTAVIVIGAVFALWYSRHMRARGVLR